MGGIRFEDLDVWKRSARLSCELYKATQSLKDWGFRDQITRSVLSISSNIAEGFERESNPECIRFLSFAKGSCGECRSQLYIGKKIQYLDPDAADAWIAETKVVSKMLSRLIQRRREFAPRTAENAEIYDVEPDGSDRVPFDS